MWTHQLVQWEHLSWNASTILLLKKLLNKLIKTKASYFSWWICDGKVRDQTLNTNDSPLHFALVTSLYQTDLCIPRFNSELQVMTVIDRITFKFVKGIVQWCTENYQYFVVLITVYRIDDCFGNYKNCWHHWISNICFDWCTRHFQCLRSCASTGVLYLAANVMFILYLTDPWVMCFLCTNTFTQAWYQYS